MMEIGKGFACVARQHSISLQILLIFL
nr:hypothetical protein [Chryseobacterium nematophagum]